MTNTNDALAALITYLAPETTDLAEIAEIITDCAEGANLLDLPARRLMRELFASMPESDNLDITAITEYITAANAELGEEIANQNELCPTCFSEIEICDC